MRFYRVALRSLSLFAVTASGCDDLATVPAQVEAVEVRAAHGGQRTAVAYSFEFDGRRFLDVTDMPLRRGRPVIGDTILVQVRSTNPLQTEIAPAPPPEPGHLVGDQVGGGAP